MERSISNEVLISLRRIIQAIDLHSRALVRKYGITGPQLIILQELNKKNELSVGEIAKAISLSLATVTGILSRLEKQGLLTRRRSEIDKRRVLIQLTDKGRNTAHDAPSPLQEKFVIQFENLKSWEQNMILSAFQRTVAMMDAKDIDASPFLMTGPVDDESNETSRI